MMKIFYVGIALFFVSISAFAQTRTTSQDGPWDNPATWGGQTVPDNNQGTFGTVTINHNVTIPQTAYPSGSALLIDQVIIGAAGNVTIDAGAEMQLNNGTGSEITINAGGTFDINGGLISNAGVGFTGTTTVNVNFLSGSYLTTSTITIPTATWDPNTTVTITGLTGAATATAAWSGVTGNLAIDCPSLGNSAINFSGFLATIESLDIQATDGTTGGRVSLRSAAGTSSTTTINSGITVSGDSRFFLATGGTQTVNLTGDFSFSPSTANFSQSASGNNTVATLNFISGDFLMSSGEWRLSSTTANANTTGTFNFQSGNMLVSAGTINEQGNGQGVVNFTAPTGDQSFDLPASGIVSGATINMTIDKATSGGVNFTNSHTIGALTLTNGRLLLNSNVLILNGAITTTNGVVDPANGSISIGGSGAFTGTMLFEDNATIASFTLNRAGTLDVGNVTPASDIELGALTLSTGTLQKTAGTLFIQDAATITRSAGTLILGSAIVPLGVYDLIYSNNVILTTGPELSASATAIRNFTKQGTSTLTLDKDLTAGNSAGTFLISAGTFTASTFATTVRGSVNTISSTANFAALNVNGPLTQSSGTTTTLTGNLAVGTSGSVALTNGTTTFGGTTIISNSGGGAIAFNIVTISGGQSMTAPSGTISIAGNFSGTGTFNNGSGTVVFNGTTTLLNAVKTFNHVTVNNASTLGGIISFRVDGNLINNGAINFTSGTLTWGGSATFSGTPTLTTVNNLTVNTSAVLNLTLAGNMTIGGNLVLTATAPAAIFNHQTTNDLTIGGTNTIGIGTTFTSLGRVIFTNAAATFGGAATSVKSFTSLRIESGAVLTFSNNTPYSFAGTGTLEVLGTLVTTAGGTSTTTVSGNTTIINTGTSTTFTNLLISGSLTATGTVNLTGNFTNDGTFNPGTGTIVFTNATNGLKTISGSQPATFNNVTVQNNTANPDVSISGNANLRGILSLDLDAVLDADGAGTGVLTLLSTSDNPTSDASIATLTGTSAVTGNVTIQRFMTLEGPNANRIYRYISAPVQNAPVSDMQVEIPVTGPFTGTTPCSGCNTAQSMFLYNETVITDTNLNTVADLGDGYEAFPAAINSETFAAGRGYSMYIRANLLTSALWDLRGPINQGNVTPVPLPTTFTSSGVSANDGWNLVGNPYPSTIDWNSVSGWVKTNVGGTIYMRDNGNSGVVSSWNGSVGTNGGTQYISIGQAFWVQTTGAPSLTADENVKVAGQQTTFIRGAALTDVLRITMSNGTQSDETVIHFRNDAKAEYDIETDARKLSNPIFNLATILSTGEVLAINSKPFTCSDPVKLFVYNAAVGTYQLNFSEMETFGGSADITLTDNFLNKTINVGTTSQYDFEVTSSAASSGANRFFLTFSDKTLPAEISLTSQPACDGESATLVLENPQVNAYYQVFKDGVAISDSLQASTTALQLTVDKQYLTLGLNNVIIQATGDKCWNTKTYQGSVSVNERPAITVTNGDACKEGAVTLKATSGQLSDAFEWYADETSQEVLATSAEYVTPVISKSKTYYVSARSASGCSTERMPVAANVIQFEDALITLNESGSLESNYEDGNQWYFNGAKLEGTTSNAIVPDKSGTYSVEVSTGGCTSTADFVYTITAIGENGLAANGISVYPNPVIEKAYIDVLENKMDISRAVLYNSIGKALTEASWVKEGKNKRGTVDMESLPVGIYILHFITSDNRIVSFKIYKK